MTCLIQLYGADAQTVDAARFYYGNPNAKYEYNFDGDFFEWTAFDYKVTPKMQKRVKTESFKREADHEKIIKRCAAMEFFVNNPLKLDYGIWFSGLNILAFCTNGENEGNLYFIS